MDKEISRKTSGKSKQLAKQTARNWLKEEDLRIKRGREEAE